MCRNYETRQPDEENYSGVYATAFRIMILMASWFQWEATSLDVKIAFLNAEMSQKEDDHLMLVLPPTFFVDRSFLAKDTYYLPPSTEGCVWIPKVASTMG